MIAYTVVEFTSFSFPIIPKNNLKWKVIVIKWALPEISIIIAIPYVLSIVVCMLNRRGGGHSRQSMGKACLILSKQIETCLFVGGGGALWVGILLSKQIRQRELLR